MVCTSFREPLGQRHEKRVMTRREMPGKKFGKGEDGGIEKSREKLAQSLKLG